MSPVDPDTLERARRASEKLAGQLLHQSGISLIDIGHDPEDSSGQALAIRVHVRRPVDQEALGIPAEIDGFPVRILAGDYHLE